MSRLYSQRRGLHFRRARGQLRKPRWRHSRIARAKPIVLSKDGFPLRGVTERVEVALQYK
jgi:hypothetical protein